ncbi:undecaprenyl diphosphate synthase family protein [Clostridium sp. AWRP]|nr:undecaprenyl diphosphate synthase family protein [Clostridium sp. AWRP]
MAKHIGTTNMLSSELINEIRKTENNLDMILNIALNYGGRSEIVNAAKKHDVCYRWRKP